ncbi:hypothetical protein HanIR_Chr05g0220801 [Helianthus annuus]|nr:hypothetical protein HanIR_Chr05g0220801 [Helianthus annuus]
MVKEFCAYLRVGIQKILGKHQVPYQIKRHQEKSPTHVDACSTGLLYRLHQLVDAPCTDAGSGIQAAV